MSELHEFQISVSTRWLERADQANDIFAKFFFLFAAFNSLYFLWGQVDRPLNSEGNPAGEAGQIDNLIRKIDEPTAIRLLAGLPKQLEFFDRREPIQRMDQRLAGEMGDPEEGRRWKRKLSNAPPRERIRALARVLYLIRSNLVHGNKVDSGDDEALIGNAVPVLRAFVDVSLRISRQA